jgi:hypothetical protein
MDTTASVEKKDGLYSFSLVERLCRENYFRNNGDAYKTALEDSIRNNTLDVLEVLIAAENATKMYPLHMSTLYGVLEPLELLVSAGFKCSLKNREELTALHCAATSSTTGSALCAMFIGLRDPNSLHIRDAKGSLPIHIAVERNNFQVMKALIEAGTKLNSTNAKGLDVRALAKQLNRNDMLEYIAETESSKKRGKKRGQAATAEPVNMERVMKVWEKFFENAMARNGLTNDAAYGDEEEDEDIEVEEGGFLTDYVVSARHASARTTPRQNAVSSTRNQLSRNDSNGTASSGGVAYGYRANTSTNSSPYQSSASSAFGSRMNTPNASSPHQSYSSPAYGSRMNTPNNTSPFESYGGSAYASYSNNFSPYQRRSTRKSSAKPYSIADMKSDPYMDIVDYFTGYELVREWFSWILCYGTNGSEVSNYFVVHRYGYEPSRWLSDHLAMCERSGLLEYVQSAEENHELGWPKYVHEAIQQGYILFFEDTENVCKWMRIQTGEVETYLPLGEDSIACDELGFVYCSDSNQRSLWVSCPQDCTITWILVFVGNQSDNFGRFSRQCSEGSSPDESKHEGDNDYYDLAANRKKVRSQIYDVIGYSPKQCLQRLQNSRRGLESERTYSEFKNYNNDPTADYYYNRVTGSSCWHVPAGYEEYVESVGGWQLCMSAESNWQPYW